MMDVNKEKVQFNFLKDLEIKNINKEVEQLHPCTHEFWEEDNVRKSLLDILVGWSRNTKAYVKKTHHAQDDATHALKSDEREESSKKQRQKLWLQEFCLAIITALDHFYSIHSFVFDPVQLKN